jgi:hypothetical protein
LVPAMVPNYQNSNRVVCQNSIKYRKWEAMNQASADLAADFTVEIGRFSDSLYRTINFVSKLRAQTSLFSLVMRYGLVQICHCGRVVFDLH